MNYDYDSLLNASTTTAATSSMLVTWLISAAIGIVVIIAMWKIFTKAGKPGWAAIVPIYNIIVMLEVVQLPLWYIVLMIIPIANIYAAIKIGIQLAKVFGKSGGFAAGLILLSPIFYCILGFGKDTYQVANPVAEQ